MHTFAFLQRLYKIIVKIKSWLFSSQKKHIGAVLKCALLKIAHDKYRTQKWQHNALTDINELFHSAQQGNSEVASLMNSYTEILNPVRVLELFERIPTDVCFNENIFLQFI
jgi:hypothetical protein